MKTDIRNIYQLKAYTQMQKVIYLLMVLSYIKALHRKEDSDNSGKISIPAYLLNQKQIVVTIPMNKLYNLDLKKKQEKTRGQILTWDMNKTVHNTKFIKTVQKLKRYKSGNNME